MYYSNVRRVMLYGSETWPITKVDLLRLQRNDRAMIRRICGVRFDQVRTTPSADLLSRLDLFSIESHLRDGRLRWYGHVHRSSGAIKEAFELSVDGQRPPGRPRKTWKDVIADDLSAWDLNATDPSDRVSWRKSVKIAMRADSQTTGTRTTAMEDSSQPAR